MQLIFTKAFLLFSLSALPFVLSTEGAENYLEIENAEVKKPGSHHLIVGQPSSSDRLLLHTNVYVPRKLFKVVEKEINFPIEGQYNAYPITSVQCWDGKSDGTGAFAKIKAGGVGTRNVTVHFKSQRSHGIHFTLKIFGRGW